MSSADKENLTINNGETGGRVTTLQGASQPSKSTKAVWKSHDSAFLIETLLKECEAEHQSDANSNLSPGLPVLPHSKGAKCWVGALQRLLALLVTILIKSVPLHSCMIYSNHVHSLRKTWILWKRSRSSQVLVGTILRWLPPLLMMSRRST